jgi:hypothetical protein
MLDDISEEVQLATKSSMSRYHRRPNHPKSSINIISFMDESAGLLEQRDKHYIVRHNLHTVSSEDSESDSGISQRISATNKAKAFAAASRPLSSDSGRRSLENDADARRHPERQLANTAYDLASYEYLQYYIDAKTPEPIRTAAVQGARWWDDAFQYVSTC